MPVHFGPDGVEIDGNALDAHADVAKHEDPGRPSLTVRETHRNFDAFITNSGSIEPIAMDINFYTIFSMHKKHTLYGNTTPV